MDSMRVSNAMERIYVGNLPFELSETQLKECFQQFGEVKEALLITDKRTGRPKGFGFVEFASPEEAKHAIEKMDGEELGGRKLRVNSATPKVPAGAQ